MWHEARKQEKKIRGMMVDYKRRAERRREYYEKIKQDPAQFLQVHGRPCKIHLDPAVALAADSPATMMPWQGHADNLIDRFDVRAHLDIIPEYKPSTEPQRQTAEEIFEDRQVCYERYRTLVQNDFLGVSEDKFLYQIYLEEHFGPVVKSTAEEDKKKLADKKVAIGYVYEDSQPQLLHHDDDDDDDDDDKKDDLSDIDLDVTLDVDQLTADQSAEMNENSTKYGMVGDDFISFLHQDKEETEQLRLAKELEEEKAMYSGRKSRRERRALREKKLQGRRVTSPPSYAARESPTYKPFQRTHSTSRSRSPSPVEADHITFITSFGIGSDEENAADLAKKQTAQQLQTKNLGGKLSEKTLRSRKGRPTGNTGNSLVKVKQHSQEPHLKSRHYSSSSSRSSCDSDHGKKTHRLQKYQSRRREHSHSSSSQSSSRSRSRSSTVTNKSTVRRNYDRSYRNYSRTYNSRSRSRSRSWSRSRSRSRSRSKSWPRTKHYSRSRSRSVSPEEKKSQSRSPPNLPPPPIKSYYRHSLSRSSSDPSERSADEEEKNTTKPPVEVPLKTLPLLGKAGPSTKSKLTPQERLKKRMQMALNRQYKADKRAQMEKYEKQQQERQDRAEELREMAIRMRQSANSEFFRERERRHRMLESEREPESDSSWNRHSEHYGKDDDHEFRRRKDDSDSHSPKSGYSHRRSRSRSKERSPRRISPRRNSPRRTPPRRSKARNRSRSPSPRQRYHQSHRHSTGRSSSRSSSLRSTRPLVDY